MHCASEFSVAHEYFRARGERSLHYRYQFHCHVWEFGTHQVYLDVMYIEYFLVLSREGRISIS